MRLMLGVTRAVATALLALEAFPIKLSNTTDSTTTEVEQLLSQTSTDTQFLGAAMGALGAVAGAAGGGGGGGGGDAPPEPKQSGGMAPINVIDNSRGSPFGNLPFQIMQAM